MLGFTFTPRLPDCVESNSGVNPPVGVCLTAVPAVGVIGGAERLGHASSHVAGTWNGGPARLTHSFSPAPPAENA